MAVDMDDGKCISNIWKPEDMTLEELSIIDSRLVSVELSYSIIVVAIFSPTILAEYAGRTLRS